MSQAMHTESSSASQAWPPWTARGTGAGSMVTKAGSGRASNSSLDKLMPPATVPNASPPLHRSLLRNKYTGSADSTASDGGDDVCLMASVEIFGGAMFGEGCMLPICTHCSQGSTCCIDWLAGSAITLYQMTDLLTSMLVLVGSR